MSKRVLLIALVVIMNVFLFMNTEETSIYAGVEDNQDVNRTEGQIWIEEIETTFVSSKDVANKVNVKETIDVPLLRNSYKPYTFSRTVNVKTMYNGKEYLLFKHEIHGTVYLYEDGKVHLYSVGSSMSDVHIMYTAEVISNTIANSDGSYSMGCSEVETFSSVFDCPKMYFVVDFYHGSAEPSYRIIED